MQEKKTEKTPLYEWHKSKGANMGIFGGYKMPLWFSGPKEEHLAVLTRAGMFDTSHMGILTFQGPGALDLLQLCFSQNLASCIGKNKTPLRPGKVVYGVLLNEQGGVIDDAIVYQLDQDHYILVVNAGTGAGIVEHLNRHKKDLQVEIANLCGRLGKMDIQGPLAARVLGKVLKNPGEVFQHMPYFSFKGHFDEASPLSKSVHLNDGTPILLSRTGYTGEFGFEILIEPSRLRPLWERVFEAGEKIDLQPCGLASRDSLRTGAMLPLSHQDIGNWPFLNNPWTFALPYDAEKKAFTKKFLGREALLQAREQPCTLAFLGKDIRKVSGPAVVLDTDENEIGTVLTCVTEMGIGRTEGKIFSISSKDKPTNFKPKGLSCGFLKAKEALPVGTTVTLKDERRKIQASIVGDIRPGRTARYPIRDMI